MNTVSPRAAQRLWITWEKHRRSRGLSTALRARLCEITGYRGRFGRYVRGTFETLRILFNARGSIVFVQSPSIVLANLVTSVGRLAGIKVIVDAHNAGIEPREGTSALLSGFAQRALRQSDLVIVTNRALADQVRALGARPFVLTDPMPDFAPGSSAHPTPGVRRIVAICTWAADEPYPELIRAAALLPPGCELHITGRSRLSAEQLRALPRNVHLTGFVSDLQYTELLRGADAVVDLTTRENCLLCGAYEAISLHLPLVVSDTAALRELLQSAAIYCKNDPQSIADALHEVLARGEVLRAAARERDAALRAAWTLKCEELEALLERGLVA